MKASLQALAHCPPLSDFLKHCVPMAPPRRAGVPRLANELTALVQRLWEANDASSVPAPARMVKAFKQRHGRFDTYQQQDGQDYLAMLLEDLDAELPIAPPPTWLIMIAVQWRTMPTTAWRATQVTSVVYCRRSPIGVVRFGLSLRSARTVLENTMLTTALTVVLTGVPYTSEVEHRVTRPL